MASDQSGSNVPQEDIDYAVDNALWAARVVYQPPAPSAVPKRSYIEVFESALETHWGCLLTLHSAGENQDDDQDSTTQQRLLTDGGQVKSGRGRRLGPHRVPQIACGKCGMRHHIDAASGEHQGRCRECSGFLRQPTDAEERKFYDFIVWNSRHLEAEREQSGGGA